MITPGRRVVTGRDRGAAAIAIRSIISVGCANPALGFGARLTRARTAKRVEALGDDSFEA
jgi:hypothetical protein